MKLIVVSEEKLDILVEEMLAKLERDALKESRADGEPALSYRRVNYDVRVLVDNIKEGPI